MSTAELKSNLHRLIVETNDANILLKMHEAFIALKASNSNGAISENEKARIEKGLKDIEEGKVFAHEEVRSEINKWIAKNS